MAALGGQVSLFGHEPPACDETFASLRRLELDRGAWIDHVPGWLAGHAEVFDGLARTTTWHADEREMYERIVDVPRLCAMLPADGQGHPVLERMRRALSTRYATDFTRVSLAYYRHGQDSVAWHGDQVARRLAEAVVATVSLGSPRRFLMRPHGGGPSQKFALGWGDLLVMGGTCQRTYQHSIPKVAMAEPRIAVMFRPHWPADR